jgi:hypothetical protein
MLIRVVTTRADVPPIGEDIAFVHGEIQPEVAAMDGNRGFAMAVDRSCGGYVSIAAWTDAEALEASGHRAPALIADLARRLHDGEPTVEVFDLVLAHVVKPVRLGHWGRSTRLEVPVGDLARASQEFRQMVLAWFERYEGLAAIVVFVDRAAGVLGGIFWYDSFRVLKGSAARFRELHDLLVADIPTVRLVEDCELQVVVAEMSGLSGVAPVPYAWN